MSAKTSYRVVVLFEDELRTAARLLRGYFDAERSLTSDEAVGIVEACFCALQGAEDEDAVLVMGRKPVPTESGNDPKRADRMES